MKISNPKRDPVGLLTLPVSGVLALTALMIRGPIGSPLDDIAEWSRFTSSGIYLGAQIAMIIAYVLPFYGLCSLYVYLHSNDRVERMAFIGMVTSLMGTALALPASGIFAFVAPVVSRSFLHNQINISQVFIDSVSGPGLIVGIVSAVLYTLGPIFLGVAVWRCSSLPKWAGACFASHGVLLSFGFSFFPALILGWVLFTLGGGWITWSILKQTSIVNGI
jgi:hypothetical protein